MTEASKKRKKERTRRMRCKLKPMAKRGRFQVLFNKEYVGYLRVFSKDRIEVRPAEGASHEAVLNIEADKAKLKAAALKKIAA